MSTTRSPEEAERRRIHSAGFCCIIAAMFLGSGCAFTTDKIDLAYKSRGGRESVSGAGNVEVSVEMTDSRSVKDNVGRKVGGGGGRIVSRTDVVELFKSAIESELSERGFGHGDEVKVSVQLHKFYNEFKMGFWAGDSIAEAVMEVTIDDSTGNLVYSNTVVAEGLEGGIQVAAGHNAEASLGMALANAVSKLFADPGFVPALFKAAGEPVPSSN